MRDKATWNEETYVDQWLNNTQTIKNLLGQHCPELLEGGRYGYFAPSFANVNNYMNGTTAWNDGLDDDKNIRLFSSHK